MTLGGASESDKGRRIRDKVSSQPITQSKRSRKMKKPKCQDCRYWEEEEDSGGNEGDCRKYAPMQGGFKPWRWSVTKAVDWCGEFDMRTQKVKMPEAI